MLYWPRGERSRVHGMYEHGGRYNLWSIQTTLKIEIVLCLDKLPELQRCRSTPAKAEGCEIID